MIKRRAFVRELIAATTACTVYCRYGAAAQPTAKLPRVALVSSVVPLSEMAGPDPVNASARSFLHGLRDLGYVEGRNIVTERRSAEGQPERLPVLLQELVATSVDVIVAGGLAAQDAQRVTDTIPIVALIDDPNAAGLSTRLGRPSRNVTGVTTSADSAIHAKRLQLLQEAVPMALLIATIDYRYVNSNETPGTHMRRGVIDMAARALGLQIVTVGVDRPEDFEPAFARIVKLRAHALIDMDSGLTQVHRRQVIDFAAQQRLPAIYPRREFVGRCPRTC
jgi:putative ABC transport system substrate-binding protein